MDELLHHCLRELAFDGDLGCNVSRLRDFINDFYAHAGALHVQTLDDAFSAYVWSLLVQQSTVIIGLIPDGVTSEVWVAPQVSAKRKAMARGEDENTIESTPPKLEIISEAKTTPLDIVRKKYGDRLRIAAEPDAIFAAVTGSHIRSSKMSPMVYSTLQIIMRGRDTGVSIVDLGKRSGYDQKTCFYLVRQLTDLGLVLKVRRGGVGTHFAIHKYFFERSSSWKAIREEENEAENQIVRELEEDSGDEDGASEEAKALSFTPIDARHLSSLPLISARVIKLLKASKNHIHSSKDILMTLGFSNPTKTDRRFFRIRVKEMVEQGLIERVMVSRSNNIGNGLVLPDPDEDFDDGPVGSQSGIKVDATVHKQIVDLIEESGTSGMTLSDLTASLHNFDRRTVELILNRSDKTQSPPHLLDMHVVQIMETRGRERRHRYYTIRNYRQFLSEEALDKTDAGHDELDLENAGGFAPISVAEFYKTGKDLARYSDTFKSGYDAVERKKQKRGYKNPVLADGTIKKGRPRKTQAKNETAVSKPSRGRKRVKNPDEDTEDDQSTGPPPKKCRAIENSSEQIPKARPRSSQNKIAPSEETSENKQSVVEVVIVTPRRSDRRAGVVLSQAVQEEESPRADLNVTGEQGLSQVEGMPMDDSPPSPPSTSEQPSIEISTEKVTPTKPQSKPSSLSPTKSASLQGSLETGGISSSSRGAFGSANRVNVSHLRRENEVIRMLEEAGGIVNIQTKDFYQAHMTLLESLSDAGEPSSAPSGTRTDKRTMNATFDSLEQKGRVKRLKTSVSTSMGINRITNLVYLPSVNDAQLTDYLQALSQAAQRQVSQHKLFTKLDEGVEYEAGHSVPRRSLHSQLLGIEDPGNTDAESPNKTVKVAKQLVSLENATKETFLAERTTLAQMYGFIVAKALRCRRMHLSVFEALETQAPVTSIVSYEKRIIEVSFLMSDLPLDLCCSLVAPLNYDEELLTLLSDETRRKTPVKDLPENLQSVLQVGRSRYRARLWELLQMLRALKLVTPLNPSDSSDASVNCAPSAHHPSQFEVAPSDGWTVNTPAVIPTYWLFHDTAPVHLWAVSESEPPVLKTASVSTRHDAVAYWDDLQEACLNADFNADLYDTAGSDSATMDASVGKSLRRMVSWRSEYFLTFQQTEYLNQISGVSGTDLDGLEPPQRDLVIDKIHNTISAPKEVIETFFATKKAKIARGLQKSRRRKNRKEEPTVTLAKKAEEARHQREAEWIALLSRVHPQDLPLPAAVRIARVRKRFLEAGSVKDIDKWESEIQMAFHETDLASRKGLKIAARPPLPKANVPPMIVNAAPSSELTIYDLIEMQGPPIDHESLSRKRKRKQKAGEEAEPKKTKRRHRFQWNADFDELARDASVIVRARCRSLPRLDWGAFEQVFPAVSRNTVRQRLVHIKETPGNEAYLRRLEDVWYDLWMKHRGTDALPDDDLKSPSNFDLIKHVEFLRSHIDKHALRIGVTPAIEKEVTVIPATIEELQAQFQVVERERIAPDWDYMWNALVEEGREKKLKRQAFSRNPEIFPPPSIPDPEEVLVAECAVKMVMGTPPERYDSGRASLLLKSRGDALISTATKNLLSRGILSKLHRDPKKPSPGRSLKISESNQNAVGGSISHDTFQDAVLLLEEMDVNDRSWHEWPLIATDGDCAALLQLFAEDKVEFSIDTSSAQAARPALDWNSKKADDDQIEAAINVRYNIVQGDVEGSPARLEDLSLSPEPIEMEQGHGLTSEGLAACCQRNSPHGLVNCAVCLDNAWNAFRASLDNETRKCAEHVMDLVHQAGEDGVRKSELTNPESISGTVLVIALEKMVAADIPQLYWTGYDSLVLVSARHVAKWAVTVSRDPVVYVFPRRWLDIKGQRVSDFWQAALRAVISCVLFRPGISQTEIRWRLRTVYDRQELIDVLRYLSGEGYLQVRFDDSTAFSPFDETEETRARWFIGDKHWYQT